MKASKRTMRQATQLFRSCVDDGVLDERKVRNVVQQLAAALPRGYLETLSAFLRLVRLESVGHTAKIESAQPLPADIQANVIKKLAAVYGAGLSASFAQNPALIGGMRIQVGSDVYDGSVRGRLSALERNF